MLKTFRVFSRAVNKRGYTVGITQNVKAENVQAAISTVINKSAKAGLSGVIIHAVHEIKGGGAVMQQMTLAEASLQAQQVEVISRMIEHMIERYHEEIDDHDLSVIAGLIKQLSSNVAVWLMTEEEKRGEQ
ncbi:hypothetical protein KBS15_000468 [Escherichia coli]|nr:hypothetical protein [Escherichia coli]HAX2328884.1 hypothetical protein [Escherichia coli]